MSIFDDFPRGVPGRSNKGALLGTACWSATAPLWKPGMILLGLDDDGQEVGYIDDRHMVTVAGSRGGKGVSMILPNLRRWPGSCAVLDPKGENATITAATRAAIPGHEVAVVDPCRAATVPEDLRVSFNPLDLIDADDDDAIDLAAAIGDAVTIGSGDGKDVHWNESARQVFEGVMLYVAVTETDARRSLVRVRQLLTQGDPDQAEYLHGLEVAQKGEDARVYSPFDALWHSMSRITAKNGAVTDVIRGVAHTVHDMGDNERGSVLSTARRNTKFIDSPWMRRCLQGGSGRTLDIDKLKAAPGGLSVYICMPARFVPTHARFMRLILNLMLYRMEAQGLTQPGCGHAVLMVLDEASALGRMEAIEKAAGLMAGYGVKLWTILQDLGQLKRHYKESWETFLGNAGVLQFFANSDLTTLEWLSKRMGQVELIRETCGSSESTTTSLSKSQSVTAQSGWSQGQSISEGRSDMPELQSVAARESGSGLMPFIARAAASDAGHSQGRTDQSGKSGGESRQNGDSATSGSSNSATVTQSIHQAPLMTIDEIARHFDRKTGRQIVFIDSQPVALTRMEYDAR